MKALSALLIFALPVAVFAAEGHGEGIPKVIIYQLINVILLVGGLVYFTKDAVVTFFTGRKKEFLAAAEKSASAREEAERNFSDIKGKLENMVNTREEAIKKAEAQAQELREQILADANEVSKRIREEAQITAQLEMERAQRELRQDLIKASVDAAHMVLAKDIGAHDQKKLQDEFINNIEVVSQ